MDVAADRLVAETADHAGFFECLACGRLRRRASGHRPALRQDPTAPVSRRHQQHLDAAVAADAPRQSGVLPCSVEPAGLARFRGLQGQGIHSCTRRGPVPVPVPERENGFAAWGQP
jgi:hypothetical protein